MIWNKSNGLVICTKSGGVFTKDCIYPFYVLNGYSFVCAIDLQINSSCTSYPLYTIGYKYKIDDEFEDAEFVRCF